jgi:signal transduction histidine kinase
MLDFSLTTDRLRLQQILVNLIGNANKFTEKGKIHVHCERRGSALLFSISDTGIGRTPETLSQLFNPFVQGDSSMSKKFGGTGLGLSISKRLVEALGGKIEVSSRPSVGSVFSFQIKPENLNITKGVASWTAKKEI